MYSRNEHAFDVHTVLQGTALSQATAVLEAEESCHLIKMNGLPRVQKTHEAGSAAQR